MPQLPDPVVRVVGVALIADGPAGPQVLAARRASPPQEAGRWELPGGKCEPGEELAEAGTREVREELGCTVRVTGRLGGRASIRPGLTLEVVTAELVAGEPVPREHDEVRWLGPDQLDSVCWLPADIPFLEELSGLLAGHREPTVEVDR